MHKGVLERVAFICPECRKGGPGGIAQSPLNLETVFDRERDHILEGIMRCTGNGCNRTYPIVDGVPIILKNIHRWWHAAKRDICKEWGRTSGIRTYFTSLTCPEKNTFSERSRLSATVECHHAPPAGAPELPAGLADPKIFWDKVSGMLRSPDNGTYERALDLGCAAGRLAGELSCISDLAVGIDTNFNAVSFAAALYRNGRADWERKVRGLRFDNECIETECRNNICFVLADALDPPFPAATFDLVAGLNLLDSIRLPLVLLGQMDALLRDNGKLLLSAPYEWRPDISDISEWLEKKDLDAPEVIRRILQGTLVPETGFHYTILSELDRIPWMLRNHDRFWSLFFVHMILSEKLPGTHRRNSHAR